VFVHVSIEFCGWVIRGMLSFPELEDPPPHEESIRIINKNL